MHAAPSPRMRTADMIVTIGIAGVAALWGIAALVIGAFGTINALVGQTVTLPQPVSLPTPQSAPDATTRLVEGVFRSADITVSGASGAVRGLLASSTALDAVMHVVVVAAVIGLCVGIMRGRPFRPSLRRMFVAAALALIVGGLGSSALLGFANLELAHDLDLEGFPMVANISF